MFITRQINSIYVSLSLSCLESLGLTPKIQAVRQQASTAATAATTPTTSPTSIDAVGSGAGVAVRRSATVVCISGVVGSGVVVGAGVVSGAVVGSGVVDSGVVSGAVVGSGVVVEDVVLTADVFSCTATHVVASRLTVPFGHGRQCMFPDAFL